MARKSRTTLEPAPVPVGENITNQMSPRALTKLEFGRRLHKLILERGWNQSDLARAASMPPACWACRKRRSNASDK